MRSGVQTLFVWRFQEASFGGVGRVMVGKIGRKLGCCLIGEHLAEASDLFAEAPEMR